MTDEKYKCEKHQIEKCEPCIGFAVYELVKCQKAFNELQEKYQRIIEFLKQEISLREYICVTNHACLLDNAETLLRKLGELK